MSPFCRHTIRLNHQYAELEVPVTLVFGECDWSSSSERSETRTLMRPQHYFELENTEHFSLIEVPEKVPNIIKSLEHVCEHIAPFLSMYFQIDQELLGY